MSDQPSGFTKSLDVRDRRKLQFQFDGIAGTKPKQFSVSVFASGKRICFFHMCKKGEAWKIINAPKVNDELLLLEEKLTSFIEAFELKYEHR